MGGVGQYDEDLLTAILKESERTVEIFCQRSPHLIDNLSVTATAKLRPAFEGGVSAIRSIDRAVMATDARVVHIQYETALYGSVLVSVALPLLIKRWRKRGKEVVVTMHHVIGREFGLSQLRLWKQPAVYDNLALALLRNIQKAIANAASKVIVHEKSQLRAFSNGNIVHIPLGIRRVETNGTKPHSKEGIRVAFFGFLAPYKGVLELAQAVAGLAQQSLQVSLDVVGGVHPRMAQERDYARFLKALNDSGDPSSVRIHGYLAPGDVDQILREADLVLFPYKALIGSSAATMHVAALGVPFAVSHELGEAMGLDARIPRCGSTIEQISALLKKVLEGSLSLDVGAVKELAESRYWDRVAKQHLELYEKLD